MEVMQLMKRILWIPLLAASLALWSCSRVEDDGPDFTTDPSITETTDGWLGITLKDADASSRADGTHKEYDDTYERFEWFNKGTADERAIIEDPECNRVLFFGSDESYFGSGKLQKPTVTTGQANIYVAKKPAGLGKAIPAWAMVVLNGDPDRLDALDEALATVGTSAVKTALTWLNEVDTDDPESLAMHDGYFTMSSTAYRADESDELTLLVPLDPDGPVFYETEEEAVQPENLTTFHVERLLAKFTLIIRDGNQRFGNLGRAIIFDGPNQLKVRQHYAPEDGQNKDIMSDWKINLVNWGMNGLEKDTYLVKNLVAEPGAAWPWTVDENFYIGWNAPTLFRSYWGMDPNYSDGFYPDQYRQAFDNPWVQPATTDNIYSPDYAGTLTKDDYTLIYKPFNAFTDRTDNKYALENTFDESVMGGQDLNTQPWLRRGTHIILTAQLIIDEIDNIDLGRPETDETGLIKGIGDKYFSNGLWWSETALLEQAVATLMTNIYYSKKSDPIPNVLKNGESVPFINDDDHILNTDVPVEASVDGENWVPLTHENLKDFAPEYFEFAPAFIQGGDGWVTLKKKDGVLLRARYIQTDPVEITDEQLVSYIYRFTNLAKHFKEGRMYYAIAIRHNLDSRSFETDPVETFATGDYGVVRNTWYRMTLYDILRPGTPVDDPDQPIIPNPEPDDKSLGVEVEVIPWRTVDINVDQLH